MRQSRIKIPIALLKFLKKLQKGLKTNTDQILRMIAKRRCEHFDSFYLSLIDQLGRINNTFMQNVKLPNILIPILKNTNT